MLSINYNDTQSAQNNSNHSVLIDHYIIINQSSAQPILKFNISQCLYKVKLVLANTKIRWLNYAGVGIHVVFIA